MLFTTAFVSSLLFSGAVYAQNGNQAPQNGQSGQNGQNGQNAQTDQNGQNAQNGQSAQNAQGMVNVHVVQVGDAQGSKKFYPESLTANPGEMVQFQFHPKVSQVLTQLTPYMPSDILLEPLDCPIRFLRALRADQRRSA